MFNNTDREAIKAVDCDGNELKIGDEIQYEDQTGLIITGTVSELIQTCIVGGTSYKVVARAKYARYSNPIKMWASQVKKCPQKVM